MGTVPTPTTMVAGTSPTAANLNTFRDGVNWAQTNRPLAVLRHSTGQNIPNNTNTGHNFDTEEVDRDGGHSVSVNSSRYTAQTAGWYRVRFGVGFVANATGTRQWIIRVNGSTTKRLVNEPSPSASGAVHREVGCMVSLAVSDYVEGVVFQTSGGTLATDTAGGGPYFEAEWVGTA